MFPYPALILTALWFQSHPPDMGDEKRFTYFVCVL